MTTHGRVALCVVLLGLLATLPTACRPAASYEPLVHWVPPFARDRAAVYPAWLRADPRFPRTLFLYGTWACAHPPMADQGFVSSEPCSAWVMRSTDGGTHWQDLRGSLSKATSGYYNLFQSDTDVTIYPLTFAANGKRAYLSVGWAAGDSGWFSTLWSDDGGAAWRVPTISPDVANCGGGTGGLLGPVADPASTTRMYAMYRVYFESPCAFAVSNDGGKTWLADPGRAVAGLYGVLMAPFPFPWTLVADPTHLNTLYANLYDIGAGSGEKISLFDAAPYANGYRGAARSDDAGVTWSLVISPTVSPPLTTLRLGLDPHEHNLLVGYPGGRGVPRDRIYLSADQGRHWHAATCPGDLRGVCPTFTVDNVFGAGASYALVGDGIYRFHGGDAAEACLPLSSRLPFKIADLLDVSGGERAGDPLYVLAMGQRGKMHARLWRSTDGGKSWQELLRGRFPLSPPPPMFFYP